MWRLLVIGRSGGSWIDTGNRVGEGFLNGGMYGLGPRQAEYMPTSRVRLRILLVGM